MDMDLASILSISMGLFSFLAGALLWYKGSVEKRYAAQRDFGHLKNSYNQLSRALETLVKEQDERFDQIDDSVKELKLIIEYKVPSQSKRD